LKARGICIQKYTKAEQLRTYHWVQVSREQADKLECHEKNPIPKAIQYEYEEGEEKMVEYHVDVSDLLLEFVDKEKLRWGDQSV
jgi:hypothetical protein